MFAQRTTASTQRLLTRLTHNRNCGVARRWRTGMDRRRTNNKLTAEVNKRAPFRAPFTRLAVRYYNRPWRRNPYADSPGSNFGQFQGHYSSFHGHWNGIPTPIKHLLRAFGAVYLMHKFAPWFAYYNFSMKTGDFSHGRFWTPITNLVSHRTFLHLLFNGLMLYFLGPMALHNCGGNAKRFYALFFGSGLLGSLFASANLSPNQAVLGASGCIYGLMAFSAMHSPYTQFLIYGVWPMKLWQMTAGIGVIELLMLNNSYHDSDYGGGQHSQRRDQLSHEAHVAGLVGGLGFFYLLPMLPF